MKKVLKINLCIVLFIILNSFQEETNYVQIINTKNAKNLYLIKGNKNLCFDVSNNKNDILFPINFKPETIILTFNKKCIRFEIPYDNQDENIKNIIIKKIKNSKSYLINVNYRRKYTTMQYANILELRKECYCK